MAKAKGEDQSGDPLVEALIRVRRSQREWARSQGYSFSALVRRLLDEAMTPTSEKEKP